jgi:DNA-binding transcriptional MerR regulator
MNDSLLPIAEIRRRTGVASSALRFYEDAGLIKAAKRAESGYRLYDSSVIGRIGFILRAKSLGLTLREISQLLSEPEDPRRLHHAITHKLFDTERRIHELMVLRGELEALQARLGSVGTFGCGRLGDCECWLPTEKEAKAMASEACECCGCTCPCDGSCACCGSDRK